MLSQTIKKRLFNLVENFLLHLSCNNYSSKTIANYRYNLSLFIRLLEHGHQKISTIKFALNETCFIETISLRYRNNPKIAAPTIRHYISAYRTLIKYLVKVGTLPPEFERFRFETPKLAMTLPKILPESLLHQLLTLPIYKWTDIRNRCIFELMAFSGLRIGEVLSIRITDVNLSKRQIKVLGKGNMERIVPISLETAEHIGQYIYQAHKEGNININNLLFVSTWGSKLSQSTIRRTLQQQAKYIGYQQRITPHFLRHFCATYFVRKTKDIRFVQQLLGHRNISSTQIYVHLDRDYIHQTFDEYCMKISA